MLNESVSRMLAEQANPNTTLEAEKTGIDSHLWQSLCKLGIAGSDASDMQTDEHMAILQALGYAGALVPYAESEAIGRWLSNAAKITATDIQTICILPACDIALNDDGSVQLQTDGCVVPWGRFAQQVLFSFESNGQAWIAVTPTDQLDLQHGHNMAGEPQDSIGLSSIKVPGINVHAVDACYGPQAVRARGALCRAKQMVGAMNKVNAATLQYSHDRKQFNRSLSQFQVIQSYLAAMTGEYCAALAAAEMAVAASDRQTAIRTIASAKIRAGQAARVISAHGHQVHGAIGFTREFPLNLWTRRLWSWREEYGNEAHWARELGAIIVGAGADALWSGITATVQEA
ncbi:hypothetical protein H0A66_09165 [Alcaligenaceae bacterium]|nr:hypothetical protein [Alcaligenaceae bacterium]